MIKTVNKLCQPLGGELTTHEDPQGVGWSDGGAEDGREKTSLSIADAGS